jgi:hypothetical protein
MRNVADRTDVRVEPDVILLGPEESFVSPTPADASPARRTRLRRFVEPGLFAMCAGAMLLAIQGTGGRGAPVAGPATSPSAGVPAPPWNSVAQPRLLAPQAASPGERITVLAYRNPRLCGPAQLHFDGAPVGHRLASYVGSRNPDRLEMFLTMRVPRSATPGGHKIDLYGPMTGGSRGPTCADVREHQARLASTTITVASRRG